MATDTAQLVDQYVMALKEAGAIRSAAVETATVALNAHVRPRRFGVVTGADGVYKFPGAETGLLPDVGFYAAEHRELIVDRTKPIPFAPDLAVEVASPSQDVGAMAAKAQQYLRGGTRLVWIVWPGRREIDVWHPGSTDR